MNPTLAERTPIALVVSLGVHFAIAAVVTGVAAWKSEREEPETSAVANLTGDTFDTPELDEPGPEPVDELDDVTATEPARPQAAPAAADGFETATPSRAAARRLPSTRRTGSASSAPPAQYGAVGERGAIDLATAFTRAFPQVASADPVWATAPFGRGGPVDVTFTLDPTGKLVSTAIGAGASAPLRRGIDRTLGWLNSRTFTAHGRQTTLRLTATVAPDEVHDGLHGDVFAIGGSFSGTGGSAFFALTIGRRVDLTVRMK